MLLCVVFFLSRYCVIHDTNTALFQVANTYFHRLPSSGITGSVRRLFRDVSNEEQTPMVIALQLIAFVGLPLHFVLNLCHSCSVIVAWTYACWTTTTNVGGLIPTVSSSVLVGQQLVVAPFSSFSFFSSPNLWAVFLQTQAMIRVFFGPVLLPVQVGATFFLCTKYRDVVLWTEQRLLFFFFKTNKNNNNNKTKNHPVRVRLVALATLWLVGNCIGLAAFTGVSCSVSGMACRVLLAKQ